jgi:peptidyl-prolyl cis-trans isomerase A (cyclophilin A)
VERKVTMTTYLALFALAAAVAAPVGAANPQVKLETSEGTIVLELEQAKAPITVGNFLEYVKSGFYDGTIFHRVIPRFMIQGGGFTANLEQKPTREPIVNESANGLVNKRGTIAMARTSDPNSATSQFFINLVDNAFLDKAKAQDGIGYCVFGRVVQGMKVVDAIAAVPTGNAGGMQDVPLQPVRIKKASVVGAAPMAKPHAPRSSGQQQPK